MRIIAIVFALMIAIPGYARQAEEALEQSTNNTFTGNALLSSDDSVKPRMLPNGVKWHPGHYVTLLSEKKNDAQYFDEVIDELSRYPLLRGVQIRYNWSELEPNEGVYDFSRITGDLAKLAAINKRLVILLQTKSFSKTSASPSYLESAKYDGGTFAIGISADGNHRTTAKQGKNIKLWNDNVRDRLVALMRALGAQFNNHPNLEAVALTETAMGKAAIAVNKEQSDRFYKNLIIVNKEMRNVFINTVTIQFTNYPRGILPWFVNDLKVNGIGLGGPDIFLEDKGLLQGIYPYYSQLAGEIPLAPSVQHENYYTRTHRGASNPPSTVELYHFARDDLHANYLFWTRRLYGDDAPYRKVLEMFDSPSFPNDPAGGLATECPKAYAFCVK